MVENAEGSPLLSPQLIREAAAMIEVGNARDVVAEMLGVDLVALARHLGPLAGEVKRAGP